MAATKHGLAQPATLPKETVMAPSANLLRDESSPYLLQHANNPVHWRPWGAAALAEARANNRPILLSIGYAACHWCHVMAHESFEDPETAALMNSLFVSDQGRPRGTARHRPPLHVGPACPRRTGRLAAHHVPHPRRRAVLGWHLFPAGAALGSPLLSPGAHRRRPGFPYRPRGDDEEYRRACACAGGHVGNPTWRDDGVGAARSPRQRRC